jgi:glycine betaine/choline ABC-type transport system substrate-binding protein
MKTMLAVTGLAVVLAVLPTGAVAKPDQSETDAAKQQCQDERGKTKATRKAFQAKYEGFADCVGKKAAEEEAENEEAQNNAAQECKAERSADPETFKQTYGTNKNGKNAYGKCVSGKASQKKAEMDAADAQQIAETKNAAKQCAAERKDLGVEEFRKKYGTNKNDRNAFGKCVSGKVHAG